MQDNKKDSLLRKKFESAAEIFLVAEGPAVGLMILMSMTAAIMILVISVSLGEESTQIYNEMVAKGEIDNYYLFRDFILNVFGGGNFWIAFLTSSLLSLLVNTAFLSLLYKIFKGRIYVYDYLFKRWIQLSITWAFGTGFLLPVGTLLFVFISYIVNLVITMNPLNSNNLDRLIEKLS